MWTVEKQWQGQLNGILATTLTKGLQNVETDSTEIKWIPLGNKLSEIYCY